MGSSSMPPIMGVGYLSCSGSRASLSVTISARAPLECGGDAGAGAGPTAGQAAAGSHPGGIITRSAWGSTCTDSDTTLPK